MRSINASPESSLETVVQQDAGCNNDQVTVRGTKIGNATGGEQTCNEASALTTEEIPQYVIGKNGSAYEIKSLLGQGGLGKVYSARRMSDDSVVAIKLAKREHIALANEQLQTETMTLASLKHKHIVKMLEAGDTTDGEPYLVMECLPGRTLREVLNTKEEMGFDRAINICLQIADAMLYVHKMGVVHNDLKPDNIMISTVDGNDWVHILDFGISSSSGDGQMDGLFRGTLMYMSPEQAKGLLTDHRSDVYQLGLLLFQLVFGRLPFEINRRAAIDYRTTGNLIPTAIHKHLSAMPPELEFAFFCSLKRDRDKRTFSMAQFSELLRSLQSLSSSQSLPAAA